MSLDVLEFRIENKKILRKKLFWYCGLRLVKKLTKLSVNLHRVNFGHYALCDTIYTCF